VSEFPFLKLTTAQFRLRGSKHLKLTRI